MRVHNYPAVAPGTVKPGQLRCGEHIDFGSITLLFADCPGGLQVTYVLFLCSLYYCAVTVVHVTSFDCLYIQYMYILTV